MEDSPIKICTETQDAEGRKVTTYQRERTQETIIRFDEEKRIVEQNNTELPILEPLSLTECFYTHDYNKKRRVRITHTVTNRSLRDPNDWSSVYASEVSYWTASEAREASRKGLFNYFRLFP